MKVVVLTHVNDVSGMGLGHNGIQLRFLSPRTPPTSKRGAFGPPPLPSLPPPSNPPRGPLEPNIPPEPNTPPGTGRFGPISASAHEIYIIALTRKH